MIIIDANKRVLAVDLVREAMSEMESVRGPDLIVRLHPAQEAMWENLGIIVTKVERGQSDADLETLLAANPATIGGCRIVIDLCMPTDRIHWELRGMPLLGIINLAVPPGY